MNLKVRELPRFQGDLSYHSQKQTCKNDDEIEL